MSGAEPYLAAAAVAASVGGTAASIHQSRKAQSAKEKADKASRAAAEIANQRNIRQNILQTRIRQAEATAAGMSMGVGFGSSPVQGAIGSIGTQGAANQGFARTQQAANSAINELSSQARGYSSNAATFGAIGQLPGQFGYDVKSSIKQLTD